MRLKLKNKLEQIRKNTEEYCPSCIDACMKVVDKKYLNEEATIGDNSKINDIEPADSHGRTVSEWLDKCAAAADNFCDMMEDKIESGKAKDIKSAASGKSRGFNPCFIGPTGAGKTSLIKAWADSRGYELVSINMKGDPMDFTGIKNIDDHTKIIDTDGKEKEVSRVVTIPTKAFDPFLTGEHKILFIDEINTANDAILQCLYDVFSFHVIGNGDEAVYLPALSFVVAAMNPPEYGHGREEGLDKALEARTFPVAVDYDSKSVLQYLKASYTESSENAKAAALKAKERKDNKKAARRADNYAKDMGKLDIINYLITNNLEIPWSSDAAMDSAKASGGRDMLVPRTLEAAFMMCDGTKVDFFDMIHALCGSNAQSKMIELFKNYSDKKHPANEIWGEDFDPNNKKTDKGRENIIGAAAGGRGLEQDMESILTSVRNQIANGTYER